MIFSNDSDVTVVITCCGRIDLLKQTLDSFFYFNTYPIKKIIITEDSGNESIYSLIPERYKNFFEIIVNKTNIGQIRSIDKAYALVDTDYIFHCEEDWSFYRKSFIEDSKCILEVNDKSYQVWLRSFYHDVAKEYPFHSLGKEIKINNVTAHQLLSSRDKWQGFSFNPGLRRLSDYLEIDGGYSSFLMSEKYAINVESALSQHMKDKNCFAVILENDAVAHTGHDRHIKNRQEKNKHLKKSIGIVTLIATAFILGWLTAQLSL